MPWRAFGAAIGCARHLAMRWGTMAAVVLAVGGSAIALESGSPEDVLRRYLQAVKVEKFEDAYDLVSKAMRQGKGKEQYVKESRAMMGFADVKIFDFTVYPGKVEGGKALVPNVLESQDRFVNTLGLTEYELYTLVREDGGWKVDSQILVEPAEQPKWFPKKSGKQGEQPKESASH